METNKLSRNAGREVSQHRAPWELPWPDGWRRQIYERVVSLAWPLVIGPLVPYGRTEPAYLPGEVSPRLRPVAEHLASAVVPPADQVQFLDAAHCDSAFDWRSQAGTGVRRTEDHGAMSSTEPVLPKRIVRTYFVSELNRVLTVAFDRQTAYDLSLGMPRRQERHLLELPHGECLWAEHLALRWRNAGHDVRK